MDFKTSCYHTRASILRSNHTFECCRLLNISIFVIKLKETFSMSKERNHNISKDRKKNMVIDHFAWRVTVIVFYYSTPGQWNSRTKNQ